MESADAGRTNLAVGDAGNRQIFSRCACVAERLAPPAAGGSSGAGGRERRGEEHADQGAWWGSPARSRRNLAGWSAGQCRESDGCPTRRCRDHLSGVQSDSSADRAREHLSGPREDTHGLDSGVGRVPGRGGIVCQAGPED